MPINTIIIITNNNNNSNNNNNNNNNNNQQKKCYSSTRNTRKHSSYLQSWYFSSLIWNPSPYVSESHVCVCGALWPKGEQCRWEDQEITEENVTLGSFYQLFVLICFYIVSCIVSIMSYSYCSQHIEDQFGYCVWIQGEKNHVQTGLYLHISFIIVCKHLEPEDACTVFLVERQKKLKIPVNMSCCWSIWRVLCSGPCVISRVRGSV